MKVLKPMRWKEGMFLRPHHFQQYDLYLESRETSRLHALERYAWGLLHMEVDPDSLNNFVFTATSLGAVLPDGTLIDLRQTWTPAMDAALAALADWTGEADLAARFYEAAGHDPATGRPRQGSLLSGGANDDLAALWADMSGLPDSAGVAGRLVQIMEVRAARSSLAPPDSRLP